MKIKDLYCACEERTFPIDHYTSGACKHPPGPAPLLKAIVDINAGDERHAGNRLSTTRLMACPRKIGIEDNIPSTLDVTQMFSVTHGTLLNKALDAYLPEGWKAQVEVRGRLFKRQFPPEGVEVSGLIDLLTPTNNIEDYKFHSAKSLAMKWQKPAEQELRAQFSTYLLLFKQTFPGQAEPSALTAWHGASTAKSDKPPAWFPVACWPPLSEDEIAAIKPLGMRLTVVEIVAAHLKFRKALADGVPVEDAVKGLPPAGMASSWLCSYCAVKRTCDRLEGNVYV